MDNAKLINEIEQAQRFYSSEADYNFCVSKDIIIKLLPPRNLKGSYFAQEKTKEYFNIGLEERAPCKDCTLFDFQEELEQYKDWVYNLISQRPSAVSIEKCFNKEMYRIYENIRTDDYLYWLRTEKRYDSHEKMAQLRGSLLFEWLEYRGFHMMLSITGLGKVLKDEFAYKLRSNMLSNEFWELRESDLPLNPYHHPEYEPYLQLQSDIIEYFTRKDKHKNKLDDDFQSKGMSQLNKIRDTISTRVKESTCVKVNRFIK